MKFSEHILGKGRHIKTAPLALFKQIELQIKGIKQMFLLLPLNRSAFQSPYRLKHLTSEKARAKSGDSSGGNFHLYNNIKSKLDKEVHLGEWHCVTQHSIDTFAEATDDRQWIHVDANRAEMESPFRSTVAHGFLLLALLPKLRGLEDYANKNYPGTRMLINCGLTDVTFLRPVKPGQSIRSRTVLRSVHANKRSLDIVESVSIEVCGSLRPVCSLTLKLRLYT